MSVRRAKAPAPREGVALDVAASQVLEECRMVLPGIQALFGFQLIAVFDAGFAQHLAPGEQRLHLVAIVLVVTAIALVMAPAAVHRRMPLRTLDERFVRVTSRLLALGMVPLAFAICLEVYLVARLVLGDHWKAAAIAGALFAVFVVLWLALPLRERRRAASTSPDRR